MMSSSNVSLSTGSFQNQAATVDALETASVPKTDGVKRRKRDMKIADNQLNVDKMNVSSGGKQPVMRDTVWNGNVQRMVLDDGRPKGMKIILKERGVDTHVPLREFGAIPKSTQELMQMGQSQDCGKLYQKDLKLVQVT
eukprot:Em0004g404a